METGGCGGAKETEVKLPNSDQDNKKRWANEVVFLKGCLKTSRVVQTRPWFSGSQGGDRRKRMDLMLLLRSAVMLIANRS